MDILFTFLIGDLSVGPVGDLVVRNDFGLWGQCIFEL
jgi:hypothetical protein